MKIFIVKIFSWFAKTRKLRKTTKIKKKKHEVYFTTKIMVSTFCSHGFTTQLAIVVLGKRVYRFSPAIAKLFRTRRPPSSIPADDSWQTCDNFLRFR